MARLAGAIVTYRFSDTSGARLATCDARLQDLFGEVIGHVDCTIIEGHRDEARQNEMFRTGKSQLRWPQGKHNVLPSLAVDAAPYPIDWGDRERATLFAGLVLGLAHARGLRLRWGGDWNGDWQVKDNHFDDLWHFELMEEDA